MIEATGQPLASAGGKEEPMDVDGRRGVDPVLPRVATIFWFAASALIIAAVVFSNPINASSEGYYGRHNHR